MMNGVATCIVIPFYATLGLLFEIYLLTLRVI
jgi:hypothetical protein